MSEANRTAELERERDEFIALSGRTFDGYVEQRKRADAAEAQVERLWDGLDAARRWLRPPADVDEARYVIDQALATPTASTGERDGDKVKGVV